MNKTQFLERLRSELGRLPDADVEKSVAFYAEMIADRMEEGENEVDAVAAMGNPSVVASIIIEEMPIVPKAIVKSKTKSKTLNWILAIIFSPIWLSLAIGALAVIFSVYITIWALVVTVWALAISFILGAPLGIGVFIWCLATGIPWVGMWELGAGAVLFGIGVFCLFGAVKVSGWLIGVSKKYTLKVVSLFKKKEASDEH